MKVNNSISTSARALESGKARQAGDAAKNSIAKGVDKADLAESAKVSMSARAQEIAKAKELATPSTEINEAKVARLQKLIDSGQYQVDASAVADKLLHEHATLTE